MAGHAGDLPAGPKEGLRLQVRPGAGLGPGGGVHGPRGGRPQRRGAPAATSARRRSGAAVPARVPRPRCLCTPQPRPAAELVASKLAESLTAAHRCLPAPPAGHLPVTAPHALAPCPPASLAPLLPAEPSTAGIRHPRQVAGGAWAGQRAQRRLHLQRPRGAEPGGRGLDRGAAAAAEWRRRTPRHLRRRGRGHRGGGGGAALLRRPAQQRLGGCGALPPRGAWGYAGGTLTHAASWPALDGACTHTAWPSHARSPPPPAPSPRPDPPAPLPLHVRAPACRRPRGWRCCLPATASSAACAWRACPTTAIPPRGRTYLTP